MNDRQFRFYYKQQEEIQTTVAMPCSNWFDFFSLLTSKSHCDNISSRFESPICGTASLIASLTLRVWTPSRTDQTKLCRSVCSVLKCLANYGPGNKSSSYLNQSSVMERSGSKSRIPCESSYEKFKNRQQAMDRFLQCRHFYSILSVKYFTSRRTQNSTVTVCEDMIATRE
jgi:hypothetical protein